jgi:hypothetical protein
MHGLLRTTHHLFAAGSLSAAVLAHFHGDPRILIYQPLSVFRTEPAPWLGAALFGMFGCLMICQTAVAAVRARLGEFWLLVFASVAFALTAVTPSFDAFHGFCSGATFTALALYIVMASHEHRLYLSWPMAAGVAAFVCLTLATGYGVGQKCLVTTFLVLGALRLEFGARTPVQRGRGSRSVHGGELRAWKRKPTPRRMRGSIFDPA